MRALWVTNVPPNVASASLGRAANPFGGWLDGSLHALEDVSQIGIDLAFPDAEAAGTDGEDNGHRIVPFSPIYRRDAKRKGVRRALEVLDGTEPDVLHVHGTELPHSYSFLEAARQRGLPHVVSVQGLASMCARHMAAFLPLGVVHGIGSRPWVRSDRVDGMRRSMTAAGALEAAGLSIATDAIGRTTWDRACLEAINPNLAYHHCDETLRPGFYSATWNPTGAVRHSIFVSQGHYPIKGLHLLLEALPTVISRFPDTSVLVAGTSPLESTQRRPYGRYIKSLLERLGLVDRVRFAGPLSEDGMLAEFKRASVVVCPSVIENSPNSVAEGMMLGMPVVAAHVGGVPDMITSGVDGWTYQADAPYMLAHRICEVFEDPERAEAMGTRARARALSRHDPLINAQRTLDIYNEISRRASR